MGFDTSSQTGLMPQTYTFPIDNSVKISYPVRCGSCGAEIYPVRFGDVHYYNHHCLITHKTTFDYLNQAWQPYDQGGFSPKLVTVLPYR